jgi:hypothetical protein
LKVEIWRDPEQFPRNNNLYIEVKSSEFIATHLRCTNDIDVCLWFSLGFVFLFILIVIDLFFRRRLKINHFYSFLCLSNLFFLLEVEFSKVKIIASFKNFIFEPMPDKSIPMSYFCKRML